MSYTPTVWKTGDVVSSVKLNKIETELSALDTDKANIDGYYESMTVGNAEQLVATVGVEDSVPFNFRTTGGTADVGDRKTMEVVGGTVAWNQLVQCGNFTSDFAVYWNVYSGTGSVNNGVITVENAVGRSGMMLRPEYRFPKRPTGHKVFVSFKYKSTVNLVLYAIKAIALAPVGEMTDHSEIITSNNYPSENAFDFFPETSGQVGTFSVSDFIVCDLTQMFGSTIADYIYSLEQANAGAGVAWFRKLFPKPYYAYNAGELMSVKTSAYKTTGFNQWDEEWETGGINYADGTNTDYSTRLRSKNLIPVKGGSAYYIRLGADGIGTNGLVVCFYDASGTYVSGAWRAAAFNPFTIPDNVCYMRFCTGDGYGGTYNHDICINLHWDGERDGEYEPYEAHTYALDSDLELRGIPKLDADNQLYYDGDTYESDGTVTRKYGTYTFDGTEYFDRVDETIDGVTYYYFRCYSSSFTNKIPNSKKGMQFILSKPYDEKYGLSYWYSGVLLGDKTSWGVSSAYGICFRDDSYSDVTTFKAAITGMVLVYELATPSEETADPFQTPQIVNDFGTEEFVDTRTIPIPVGHNSKYQANLRAKLEMAPNSPSGDGDYIVRQSSGQNTYVPITFPADELPAAPTTDGNYVLKCTVSSGTATFEWEAQT